MQAASWSDAFWMLRCYEHEEALEQIQDMLERDYISWLVGVPLKELEEVDG